MIGSDRIGSDRIISDLIESDEGRHCYRNLRLGKEPIDVVHGEVGQERIDAPSELRLKKKKQKFQKIIKNKIRFIDL